MSEAIDAVDKNETITKIYPCGCKFECKDRYWNIIKVCDKCKDGTNGGNLKKLKKT